MPDETPNSEIPADEENALLEGMPNLPPRLVGTNKIRVDGAMTLFFEAYMTGSPGRIAIAMADFLDVVAPMTDDPILFRNWVNNLDGEALYKAPMALAQRVRRILGESKPSVA